MAHRGWNNARMATEAGVDPGTLGDFLAGNRWPKSPTRGRVEAALGWAPGTIAGIVAGLEPPAVGGETEDAETQDELLYRRPEGLSDEEWERVKDESRGFIEWQIEKASRER